MASKLSPDEVRADHLNKLDAKLGAVFHALNNEVAWLHVKWEEYHELFGTSPQRIDILNKAAGLFSRIIQEALWESVLLELTRLTDPIEIRGRSNLTIAQLPELCDEPALRSKVSELVATALNATKFARDWRNRHIGHRDLKLAVDNAAKPLEPASRAQVSNAVKAIHAVLNHISEQVLGTTLLDRVITPATGAVSLLYVLRDGLEDDEARSERILSGKFDAEDIDRREI
jgi:hypothetical protein